MIELQNYNIALSAIHTGMVSEIIYQEFGVYFALLNISQAGFP